MGPEVAVKPIQAFFHDGVRGRNMPGIEEDMAFLSLRDTQEAKKWKLRRVHGKHEIVPAIEHEGRYLYPRREIKRLDLRWQFLKGEPSCNKYTCFEAWLDGGHDGSPDGTQTEAVKGQSLGIDVSSSFKIVDGALYVFSPLHNQISSSVGPHRKTCTSWLNQFIPSLADRWRADAAFVHSRVNRIEDCAPTLNSERNPVW